MGVDLPNPGTTFIPEVPPNVVEDNPALASYLKSLATVVEEAGRRQFTNSLHIATAMNSGTSGTFAISSGGSIVVTSGVVINITS